MPRFHAPAIALILILAGGISVTQAETVPFDSDRWTVNVDSFMVLTHLGRDAAFVFGGMLSLDDVDFTTGVIEYDVCVTGERTFVGVGWRMKDSNNFESFYIRPHQTGQPDACQYTPVCNGLSAWQLYHGQGFGAAFDIPANKWVPVKVIVSATQAEVYYGNMNTPILRVPRLIGDVTSGGLALYCPAFAPAYFSNFRYTLSTPTLDVPMPDVVAAPNSVMSWQISSEFAEPELDGVDKLTKSKGDFTWRTMRAEPSGISNLARLAKRGQETNTVFARVVVNSSSKQTRRLRFGYSDRARVFLNGTPLYQGDNTYQTRDYRYLGTIGLFDSVFLPLKKGPNELWIAVSESFGGWGIMAAFDNMDGIKVE